MFLSCEYGPASRAGSKVLLDGKELPNAYAADDEQGWAAVWNERAQLDIVQGHIEFVFSDETRQEFRPSLTQAISRDQQRQNRVIKVDKRWVRIRLCEETEDSVVIVLDNKHPQETL